MGRSVFGIHHTPQHTTTNHTPHTGDYYLQLGGVRLVLLQVQPHRGARAGGAREAEDDAGAVRKEVADAWLGWLVGLGWVGWLVGWLVGLMIDDNHRTSGPPHPPIHIPAR